MFPNEVYWIILFAYRTPIFFLFLLNKYQFCSGVHISPYISHVTQKKLTVSSSKSRSQLIKVNHSDYHSPLLLLGQRFWLNLISMWHFLWPYEIGICPNLVQSYWREGFLLAGWGRGPLFLQWLWTRSMLLQLLITAKLGLWWQSQQREKVRNEGHGASALIVLCISLKCCYLRCISLLR